MNRKKIEKRAWPGWLESLRPDAVARFRMRSNLLQRAVPLLQARRRLSWQDVAAGWSHMLAPIAAVLILFFAGLAYQAKRPPAAGPPLTLEELVQPSDPDDSFGLLTEGVEPSKDRMLSVVMNYER